MRAAMLWKAFGAGLLVAAAPVARAEGLKPQSLDSRVTSVALFKNGLAFVTREAELPHADSRLRLEALPVPVHGTFWAWAPGQPEAVRRLVASLEPSKSTGPAASLEEVLLANRDRDLEVLLADGKLFKGRALAPPERVEDRVDPARIVPGRSPLMFATSGGGTVVFDPSSIQRISVSGGPPQTEVSRSVQKARLELEAAGGGKLDIVYLSRGASWAPSYSVDLIGNDRARVTAKAEIINELEDWDGADVKLVTGFPNIAFSSVDDPIAMRGDLAAFLNAIGAGAGANQPQSGLLRQNIAFDRAVEEAVAYSTAPPAGERADELFLYPVPKFTLARGQRAYVPLFSADVAATHLYELSLDDRVRDNRFEPPPSGPQPPLEIWHRVRLTNSGTVPWTTGPAIATRDNALVAQDALDYAAPGGTSTLRITRVSDLHADADEFEVERKPRALEAYGHVYDEITVRGLAEVTSFRDEDITLTVTKSLTGAVLTTAPLAKVDRSAQRLLAVNPSSTIRWSVPLKARDKVRLEYRYKVLIQV